MKSVLLAASLCFSFLGSVCLAHYHDGHHGDGSLAHHLEFQEGNLHVHAAFSKAPVVMEEAVLVLQTMDPRTHKSVETGADIQVVLWMTSMNHGSAPTKVERATDDEGNILAGTYIVRNIYFTMGGEWEVQVHLRDPQTGEHEMQSFEMDLEGDHGGHHH